MSVNLILLTDCTAVNEVFDEGGETRPPEVMFMDRFHAENAHMTDYRGGMDQVEEGRAGRWRNIHMTFEIKVAIVIGPV